MAKKNNIYRVRDEYLEVSADTRDELNSLIKELREMGYKKRGRAHCTDSRPPTYWVEMGKHIVERSINLDKLKK